MASDEAIMATAHAGELEEFVAHADGELTYWQSFKAPLRGDDGQITGLVSTSVDITARKHRSAPT